MSAEQPSNQGRRNFCRTCIGGMVRSRVPMISGGNSPAWPRGLSALATCIPEPGGTSSNALGLGKSGSPVLTVLT